MIFWAFILAKVVSYQSIHSSDLAGFLIWRAFWFGGLFDERPEKLYLMLTYHIIKLHIFQNQHNQ